MKFKNTLLILIVLIFPVTVCAQNPIIADNSSVDAFYNINDYWIGQAKNLVRIYYGHTSHGRQITDGISTLENLDSLYTYHSSSLVIPDSLSYVETSPDAGYYPDWYNNTRSRLNNSSDNRNTVMWAWCGQLSWWSVSSVQQYLDAMTALENEYPEVVFIYMTGHLDTTGSSGTLWRNNNMIRNHVNDPDAPVRRILFDFADIERYDPDGNDYLNLGAGAVEGDGCRYDNGNWCTTWCNNNPSSDLCAPVPACAHSFTLNCNMKARAFWWMMARIAGWDGGTSGDTTPPAAISDLRIDSCDTASCDLSWPAPGDDGNTGTAQAYDVRYSTSVINSGNFLSASTVSGEPAPLAAGTEQSMTVSGLNDDATYYFAMRTRDEASNWSGISNVTSGSTDPIPDTTPPSAINNLSIVTCSDTSCNLQWTSPGDDGNTGTAQGYDIRYSTSQITISNFDSALTVSGEPSPLVAGTQQNMTVTGLLPSTTYYFAIKTRDEVPLWSIISNVPYETTEDTPDTTPPDSIVDLEVISCDESSCEVGWTSTGDDGLFGTAYRYNLRYSTSDMTELNFDSSSAVSGEPLPLAAGNYQSMTVPSLSHSTTYYFAIKVRDESDNWSGLSNVVNGTTEIPSDTTPPATITDMEVSFCDTESCSLSWTSPGDDGDSGTAQSYDIRYSAFIITQDNFQIADSVAGGLMAPQQAGNVESFIVSGLSPSTTYFFAIVTSDDSSNNSAVSNSPLGITDDIFNGDDDDDDDDTGDIDPDINPQTENDRDPYETLFRVAGGCGMSDIVHQNQSALIYYIYLTILILISVISGRIRVE